MRTAGVRQLDEQSRMHAQVSDAEVRKLLGQESQRTRTLEEAVTIFQALPGQRLIVRSEQHEEHITATQCSLLYGTKSRTLLRKRWLRSSCGADEPAMLVNSGVLGNDQGVDGEEHRDVAAQLQHSSLQIHHHSRQWRRDVVHVCAHSEEHGSDRDAGEHDSSTSHGSTRRADQSNSTCTSASRSARCVKGMNPAPHIHEHLRYTIMATALRTPSRITTSRLSTLR